MHSGAFVELAPGTVVGEYTIDALIGRGGMGTVYAARQALIGKRVAIKVLSDQLPDDPSVVRRFIDEARAVNKIGHPNIIDIFSFGRLQDNRLYFVMELLHGITLRDRLEREPLTAAEIELFVSQICGALGAAHAERIIHRDLKPENIWLATPKHGEPFVKLLDFGIAKLIETQAPGQTTATGVIMGTPCFMSPEQCQGGEIDHRTDIYALGVILYELFTGRLPFTGTSAIEVLLQHMTAVPARPSQFRALPDGVETLVLSCLEKSPAARPQTTDELLARFRSALRTQSAAPRATESTRPSEPPPIAVSPVAAVVPSRARTFVPRRALLALVSLASLALIALSWMLLQGDAPARTVTTTAAATKPASSTVETRATKLTPASTQVPTPPEPPHEPEAAPISPAPSVRAASSRSSSPSKRTPTRVEKVGLVTDNPFR